MKTATIFLVAVTVFTTLFLESFSVPVDSGPVTPGQQSRDEAVKDTTATGSSKGNDIVDNIKEMTENFIGNLGKTVGKVGETVKNVVTGTTEVIGEISNNVKSAFDDVTKAIAGIAAGGVETTKQALSTLAKFKTALGSEANALTEALKVVLGDVNKELIQEPLKEFIASGIDSTESALAELRKACEDALIKANGDKKPALIEVNDWLIKLDARLNVLHSVILAAVASGKKADLGKVIPELSSAIPQSTADAAKYSAILVANPGDQTSGFLVTFGEKFTLMGSNAVLGLEALRLLEISASS